MCCGAREHLTDDGVYVKDFAATFADAAHNDKKNGKPGRARYSLAHRIASFRSVGDSDVIRTRCHEGFNFGLILHISIFWYNIG